MIAKTAEKRRHKRRLRDWRYCHGLAWGRAETVGGTPITVPSPEVSERSRDVCGSDENVGQSRKPAKWSHLLQPFQYSFIDPITTKQRLKTRRKEVPPEQTNAVEQRIKTPTSWKQHSAISTPTETTSNRLLVQSTTNPWATVHESPHISFVRVEFPSLAGGPRRRPRRVRRQPDAHPWNLPGARSSTVTPPITPKDGYVREARHPTGFGLSTNGIPYPLSVTFESLPFPGPTHGSSRYWQQDTTYGWPRFKSNCLTTAVATHVDYKDTGVEISWIPTCIN